MSNSFCFEVLQTDGAARCGRLTTPHAEIDTPVFMPVGTSATVKALTQEQLEELDVRIFLANTYHLYLRPGDDLIRDLGGLHSFMSWPRALLTDSGGYQVFSMSELREVHDEGVRFRSHLDGSSHFFTPERSLEVQMNLGADILMCFDECTPFPCSHEHAKQSMLLTMRWAERCRDYFQARQDESQRRDQILFGINQGSVFADLRKESVDRLLELDLPGNAIGGLSVGESKSQMFDVIDYTAPLLPADRPRYLMGAGTPEDLVEGVRRGIDMFDCVLPTRNARNGWLFTHQGHLVIKNETHKRSEKPVDEQCACFVCRRYSRAYLRHLFHQNEIVSAVLNTYHNVYFYLDTMKRIRQSIASFRFEEFAREFLDERRQAGDSDF
ncbi:MAG: tRNA guanosine(34) transglycosylase Tgt [Acidobacteriia bacterium]|nr:tRNA guanosine(34) transglycosylase Tgt [Terriglobia bacterium]